MISVHIESVACTCHFNCQNGVGMDFAGLYNEDQFLNFLATFFLAQKLLASESECNYWDAVVGQRVKCSLSF